MKITERDMKRSDFWHFFRRAEDHVNATLGATNSRVELSDKVAKAASDATDALTKAALLRADELNAAE